MPPKIQRSNAKHHKSGRARLLPAQDGGEEVADHALSRAVSHAAQPSTA